MLKSSDCQLSQPLKFRGGFVEICCDFTKKRLSKAREREIKDITNFWL